MSVSLPSSISFLCMMFEDLGCIPISPESLRLAKHNALHPTHELIFLLKDLISIWQTHAPLEKSNLKNRDFSNPTSINQIDKKSATCRNPESELHFVQYFLIEKGFRERNFLAITAESKSSHDLLLLLGWMMATFDLYDFYVRAFAVPTLKRLSSFLTSVCEDGFEIDTYVMRADQLKGENIKKLENQMDVESDEHKIATLCNGVLFLYGKLRQQLLLWSCNQVNRLKYAIKLHEVQSKDNFPPSLLQKVDANVFPRTSHQIYFSSRPNEKKVEIEKLFAWLQSHAGLLKLHEMETLFWQWMVCVLSMLFLISLQLNYLPKLIMRMKLLLLKKQLRLTRRSINC